MRKMSPIRLGDVIESVVDIGSNGSDEEISANLNMTDEIGYAKMVRTVNFNANDFENNMKYISKEAYDFFSKSKIYGNEIIMNKIGCPGSLWLMPVLNEPVSLGLNQMAIKYKNDVDQIYMYYLMKCYESYIKSLAHGTTTKSITRDDIYDLKFMAHEKEEQKRIVHILTLIDKRIDNSRKLINELSKEIKQLYNFFIIQYGEQCDKKLSEKKVYNRRIPEDWKCMDLSTVIEFERGVEVGKANYTEKNIHNPDLVKFYRVSDMNKTCEVYTDKSLCGNKFLEFTDVSLSLDGTVGKVGYGLQGAYSTGIRKLISNNNVFNNALLYAIFTSDEIQITINNYATGSNILHASEAVKHFWVSYNQEQFVKLRKHITPLFEKMLLLKKEIENYEDVKLKLIPLFFDGSIGF